MSEPYGVYLRATITDARLRDYLATKRKRASTFSDWAQCDGFIDSSSVSDSDWKAWLDETDHTFDITYGEAYQLLRTPGPFGFFYEATTVIQMSLVYSQGAGELVNHLTTCRGIADFAQSGIILVHDSFIGNGTAAVFEIEAGGSRLVQRDAAAVADFDRRAAAAADMSFALPDELDNFVASRGAT